METIKSFRKQYYFLSNFYPCTVTYEGETFGSAERAFQAAKCEDKSLWYRFQLAQTEQDAKYFGRHVQLRSDWEQIKDEVMYTVLKSKFETKRLKKLLLETGDAHIEEGNNHGDRYWGTVKGEGRNQLGKTLMRIREELRQSNGDICS